MSDQTYSIELRDAQGFMLAYLEGQEETNHAYFKYPQVNKIINICDSQTVYYREGEAHSYDVSTARDGVIAVVDIKLQPFLVRKGMPMPIYYIIKHSDYIIQKPEPICTCGGWAVYGKEANIHSDDISNTCDLRKK